MLSYILPAIGLIILISFLVLAVKNRYSTSKCISCITTGVVLSTFFMIFPTQWIKDGAELSFPFAYKLISSIAYSFATLGGGQNYAQTEAIALEGVLKTVYIVINYVCFITAPLLLSGLVLSLFGDMGEKMKFVFRFSGKCHVFSELNENSLQLAKNIKKGDTVIFCSTKGLDDALKTEARKSGFIPLYKSCDKVRISRRFKGYEFYLMFSDEDRNIQMAEKLITDLGGKQRREVIINAFAQNDNNVNILEQLLVKRRNEHAVSNVRLRFINTVALFCSDIVFKHPLYSYAGEDKLISVMIVGCGKLGERMLRTAVWCGQLPGYRLKIRVYDKDAEKAESELYKNYPELSLDGYDIEFIKADINSAEFESKIEKSRDATYVVVSTGDDEMNLNTAEYLYRYFRRSNRFDVTPPIFARVRLNVKSLNFSQESDFLVKRSIFLFGTTECVYSRKTLFNTELENLALATHLCYYGALELPKDSPDYISAVNEFYDFEYNRRSSMATAIHIAGKLACCGVIGKDEYRVTDAQAEKFKDAINDEALLETLGRNEHDRWNAFMRSEGYRKASIEEMKIYAPRTRSHKDDLSKLHPCITTWDELDPLSETFNAMAIKPKKVDFKEYDIKIVKEIPGIIRKANELNRE